MVFRLGAKSDVEAGLSQPTDQPEEVRFFIAQMTPEQRLLVVLKRELYAGNWEDILTDLKARLEGRPYVFKLVHRITDDIRRVEQLRAFEQQHKVDLSDFIDLDMISSA